MSLRSIDIIINKNSKNDIVDILDGQQIEDYWIFTSEKSLLVKCLVSTTTSEDLLDNIEKAFSSHKEFRVIIHPVEATLPRIAEKDDEKSIQKPGKNKIIRVGREELYYDLTTEADLNWNFIILIVLSSLVAGIGILQNNLAIIIAAMVIAPLIGPNMALALATTLGDLWLAKKSAFTLLAGTLVALLICVIWGFYDPSVQYISKQTNISYGDLVLALVSGVAGVLAILRGTSSALVGVMVAVALLPPWVRTGLFLGSGYVENALYSFLIFSINVISLNLAGILTFLVAGIRPNKWWEVERAKIQTRKALALWVSLFLILVIIIYFLQYR